MARLLQRKCACGGTPGPTGECAECRKKRLGLQRKESGPGPAVAPPIVHDVLRSPGRPLEPETRSFMESRFGHDFGKVRVHADAQAAESARAVGALAYTVGQNVAFDAGQYAPETSAGRRLLAHELVHTIQQQAGGSRAGALAIGDPADPLEREADLLSTAAPGPAASPGRILLQRAEVKGCEEDRKEELLAAHRFGFTMLQNAASAVAPGSQGTINERVQVMGRRWFKLEWPTEQPDMLKLWTHVFLGIASLLEKADATKYRCGRVFNKLAIAWPGGRIAVYDPFWTLGDDQRAATLVHEWGHKWGRGMRRIVESYCGHEKFNAFPPEKLVQMPDAYMGFIYELSEGHELPAAGLCEHGSPVAPGPESFPTDLFPSHGVESGEEGEGG